MTEFSVSEHEKSLLLLNEKFQKGEISHSQVQEEIAKLLGETNLAFRLRNRLEAQVNGQISFKFREKASTQDYFLKLDEIENKIIASNFPFAFFQNEATLSEIEGLDIDVMNQKTLMLSVISASKSYVNNGLENDPKAQALHGVYLRLKSSLCLEIPDYPKEDAYLSYCEEKGLRAEIENSRVTGSICIFCGSRSIKSNGNLWQCRDCKRSFRKRR
jgi:hypothetical protein